jgi:menaquinone-dependent protoporphyrinogen oxidase
LNILVVYGTTEGQTRKISEWTAAHIRERGYQAELYDSADPISNLDLEAYDAFIIAASVHQECHQETVVNFVIAHLEVLDMKPSAFISVSLSAVLEGAEMEAQTYVDRLIAMTGWKPRMSLLLGGALRYTEYDYFQEQIVKFIVMKRSVAAAGHDREFTDWTALGSFVDRFLKAAV